MLPSCEHCSDKDRWLPDFTGRLQDVCEQSLIDDQRLFFAIIVHDETDRVQCEGWREPGRHLRQVSAIGEELRLFSYFIDPREILKFLQAFGVILPLAGARLPFAILGRPAAMINELTGVETIKIYNLSSADGGAGLTDLLKSMTTYFSEAPVERVAGRISCPPDYDDRYDDFLPFRCIEAAFEEVRGPSFC